MRLDDGPRVCPCIENLGCSSCASLQDTDVELNRMVILISTTNVADGTEIFYDLSQANVEVNGKEYKYRRSHEDDGETRTICHRERAEYMTCIYSDTWSIALREISFTNTNVLACPLVPSFAQMPLHSF